MKMDIATGYPPRLTGLHAPVGYVDGANLYQFVNSSPVESVDPSGLAPPASQPTQPHPNTWVIPGGFDLVVIGDPAMKTMNASYWDKYKAANKDTDVVDGYTPAAVAKAIKERSEKMRKKKQPPSTAAIQISVLILAHGTDNAGETFVGEHGAGGQLFPSPPELNGVAGIQMRPKGDVVAELKKLPIYEVKGLISDLTIAACNVGGTSDGKSLTDIVREEMGIHHLTVPQRYGDVYPYGSAIGMDLRSHYGESPIVLDKAHFGDFIYTSTSDPKEKVP